MNYPKPSKYEPKQAPDYISVPQYRNAIQVETMTLQMKRFRMLHDFMENGSMNLPTQDTLEADRNAMNIYLGMGHSNKEAWDAFKTVFETSHLHIDSGLRTAMEQGRLINDKSQIVFTTVKPRAITFRFNVKPKSWWEGVKFYFRNLKNKIELYFL